MLLMNELGEFVTPEDFEPRHVKLRGSHPRKLGEDMRREDAERRGIAMKSHEEALAELERRERKSRYEAACGQRRPDMVATCDECGREYVKRRRDQRYCGTECRKEVRRRRRREKDAKARGDALGAVHTVRAGVAGGVDGGKQGEEIHG